MYLLFLSCLQLKVISVPKWQISKILKILSEPHFQSRGCTPDISYLSLSFSGSSFYQALKPSWLEVPSEAPTVAAVSLPACPHQTPVNLRSGGEEASVADLICVHFSVSESSQSSQTPYSADLEEAYKNMQISNWGNFRKEH